MKKNKEKFSRICFLVAAICYYISAFIEFFGEDDSGMAVTHLCLGSCFLCISSSYFSKKKK